MKAALARTSGASVRWKRATGDYVESHCGRWWITPIYGGHTRPERYELRLDNRVVGGGANQRECKEDADRWVRAHAVALKATIASGNVHAMKEHPILFSATMIPPILDDRKTQTRRPIDLREFGRSTTPGYDWTFRDRQMRWHDYTHADLFASKWVRVRVGDRLWVRETWGLHAYGDETDWHRESVRGLTGEQIQARLKLARRADWGPMQEGCFWRPGIFMPRWASRISLEVTEVHPQRLQEITEDDARAEGARIPDAATAKQDTVDTYDMTPYRGAFACLWESINAKRAPWASNPWVWAYTFRRIP